jgi:hypothetical protein
MMGLGGLMRPTLWGLCCLTIAQFSAESRFLISDVPKQVTVHFRFQERALTLHEPVLAVFEVHNGLSEPITVTVGSTIREYFDFALTMPNGKILRKDNTLPPDSVTVGSGKITVEPGADYQERLVMNRWFPFEMQGTYTLVGQLTSDILTADGSIREDGETAEMTINPRDPARIKTVCAELAKEVQNAPNAAAAQEPALILSYVDDPIAVPYLEQVLSTNTLTYDKAIGGLERIGNDAAVEVLLSTVNNNANDIGDRAARALVVLQEHISNPRLKESVRQAVQRAGDRSRNQFIQTQISYLDYRDPALQTSAIQNLIAVDALQRAEPILERLANDPNQPPIVTAAAKDALQRIHSSK